MIARQVMSNYVLTVSRDTPVRTVAALLSKNRIGGVPVVDADGSVVGVVTENELVRRAELGTLPQPSRWLGWLRDSSGEATDFVRTHGLTAEDVMRQGAPTVAPDTDVNDIASVLDRGDLKRVFVADDGRLVGVITRLDLVKALADMPIPAPKPRPDSDLEQEIRRRVRAEPWGTARALTIDVKDGVVELSGIVESDVERRALCLLAREVVGVTAVRDSLSVVGKLSRALSF